MIHYPITTSRNIPEFLRLIDALQTMYKHGVATPANWQPWDGVIVPQPNTQEMAKERMEAGYQCKDWYFCRKTCRM